VVGQQFMIGALVAIEIEAMFSRQVVLMPHSPELWRSSPMAALIWCRGE